MNIKIKKLILGLLWCALMIGIDIMLNFDVLACIAFVLGDLFAIGVFAINKLSDKEAKKAEVKK